MSASSAALASAPGAAPVSTGGTSIAAKRTSPPSSSVKVRPSITRLATPCAITSPPQIGAGFGCSCAIAPEHPQSAASLTASAAAKKTPRRRPTIAPSERREYGGTTACLEAGRLCYIGVDYGPVAQPDRAAVS